MNVQDWLGADNQLSIDIWEKKYRYKNETFDQWLNRVSGGNSKVKDLILKKKFLFGGRILSNRGLEKESVKSTLSNCYVVAPPEDNIESIFECASKLARTFSYGGGVGIDISKLAPKGAVVHNAAKETSGAVSFMDLYSMITGLIAQNGRRGALMISLDCNHPDIEDFIKIKSDLDRVTKANISIKITNDFMRAVKNNESFELSFFRPETKETIKRTVNAKEMFRKICEMNYDYAEPGMLYWDNIENWNLLSEDNEFHYAGVNPCAEEPLPAGGSCLLGSINLSEFVTKDKSFDFEDFKNTVTVAVRALNDVLEEGLPLHPLQEQRDSVNDWKQIGMGIFGLADMLIKMGMTYGNEESIDLCGNIAHTMIDQAIKTSAYLAKEKGIYPKYNPETVLKSSFFNVNTSKETKELVRLYGLRNSQLLTIAPTGSLSTMLGVSGGIEPIFANYYTRKTESLHGKDKYYKVYTPIVKQYMNEHNLSEDDEFELPEYFVTAQTLNYRNRIDMQSVWQSYIDASISSTVNLPNETTIEEIEDLYMYAWERGLKGVTIFRDGCKRMGILTTNDSNKKDRDETNEVSEMSNKVNYNQITPVSRKTIGMTHGNTYCKKCACGTLYITVNRDEDGNVVETFVHTSKGGICQANSSAVTRLSSLALRSGVKVEEIADQLKGITCTACAKLMAKGEKLDGVSCPDILSKTIMEFYNTNDVVPAMPVFESKAEEDNNQMKCPDCGQPISFTEGCVKCTSCAWSKCN